MKEIYQDLKKVFEGKMFFKIVCVIGVVIVVLLIFSAGVAVGFHKASFGRAWGEHYNENFGTGYRAGYPGSMMGGIEMMGYFPNAHGAEGKVIKIELPNIIVQDADNTEKVVSIGNDTQIQKGRLLVTTADLKIEDFVVVIGTPNDKGAIEAKLIRVIPSPAPEFFQ